MGLSVAGGIDADDADGTAVDGATADGATADGAAPDGGGGGAILPGNVGESLGLVGSTVGVVDKGAVLGVRKVGLVDCMAACRMSYHSWMSRGDGLWLPGWDGGKVHWDSRLTASVGFSRNCCKTSSISGLSFLSGLEHFCPR